MLQVYIYIYIYKCTTLAAMDKWHQGKPRVINGNTWNGVVKRIHQWKDQSCDIFLYSEIKISPVGGLDAACSFFSSLLFWLTPPLWPFWFDLHLMVPLFACKHSLVLQIRFGVWSGGGTFFQLVFEWRVVNRVYVSKPIGFKVVCTCGCLWGSIMCRVCAPRQLWTEVVCGCVDCVLCIVYICTVRN